MKIYFNKTIKPSEADIVATGPSTKKVAVADKGIIFKTDLENMSVGIINDEAAIKGYSYLLVADGLACLCSCVFNDLEKLDDCFLYTKNYFTREYELKIKDEKKVGGIGYVSIDNVYKKGQTLFVGEAAGIQDLLGMFGMRTAIRSGFLASKAILEKLDYEKLAKDEFKKHIEAGVVNRYVWEHHDFDNYLVAMKKINQRVHSTDWLKSIYNFNLIEHIEYPVALHWIKKQYPELLN